MRKQKNHQYPHDGHGYISNRGISKYLGVTVNSNPSGRIWKVSFNNNDVESTVSLQAKGFVLSEVEAARIAAAIFDAGATRQCLPNIKVKSADGNYFYTIVGTQNAIIRRPVSAIVTFPKTPDVFKRTTTFQKWSKAKKNDDKKGLIHGNMIKTEEQPVPVANADAFAMLITILSKMTFTEPQKDAILDVLILNQKETQ